MSKSTPMQCVVCGLQFGSRLKAGEITIRISVKAGHSMAIAAPVCSECAAKSASNPGVALSQMRQARGNLLMGGGGAHGD